MDNEYYFKLTDEGSTPEPSGNDGVVVKIAVDSRNYIISEGEQNG